MATTVVKTIGNGTRDYTSIQAWEDACPSNLVTADQIWEGQLYKEGAGTDGEWTHSSQIVISGTVADATRFVRLRCAAGESFTDNASKLTNALRYNPANGVAIRCTNYYTGFGIYSTQDYLQIDGLQIAHNDGKSAFKYHLGVGAKFSNSIFQASAAGSYGVICVHYCSPQFINCAVIQANNAAIITTISNGMPSYIGCTFYRTSSGVLADNDYGGDNTLTNCAIFGTNNATTNINSGSSYNAVDLSSMAGTNNQVSLTGSSQFENIAGIGTLDLRAKSGNGLQYGTLDSRMGGVDVVGQTRAATPTMGAWEYSSGGSGHQVIPVNSSQANTASQGAISQSHLATISNSTQANTSAQAAIQQTHLVSVASSNQSNVASAAAISQSLIQLVTVSDSNQANTASSAAIGQTHLVSVSSGNQANVATPASVTQSSDKFISIADSTQANAASAGSIKQTHLVQCAGVAIDNVASGSAVVQVHLLTAANSTQVNTCSAVDLTNGAYVSAPSGSGPMLISPNTSRPMQTIMTRPSNTGGRRH